MKIVHLCLASFFPDNYSYQENMLPKFHKQAGHDVEVIASLQTFDNNGKVALYDGPMHYMNEFDIPVTRLMYKRPTKIFQKFRRYLGLREALERAKPDVVFVHGCQFMDMTVLVKYVNEHPLLKIYVDNHADKKNSAKNWLSYYVLHGIFWKYCARIIEPSTVQFYGVLPARVDFLVDMYKLPSKKCSLLVMGADDDAVERVLYQDTRNKKREEYGLNKNNIVIVTGGKIDQNKPQTLILMDAINHLQDDRVVLLVFGSVSDELRQDFENRLSERVIHIGWRQSEEIYSEYAVADLVAFPGLHSVLWEQAVGMGKPCIFRRMEGFAHVDLGGNCMFFERDTVASYINTIQEAVLQLEKMTIMAREKGMEKFLYRNIAEKSLEVN